jgi:ketosteroid isomerase-like protein
MYHQIVKQILRQGFQDISQGNFEKLLNNFADDVHFTFTGQTALGADVHSKEAVRQWFQRVNRIFPNLQIEAKQIYVMGFPWNTVAAVQFVVTDTLADGTKYENHGVQIVRIVWGKVVEDYLKEDTLYLSQILEKVAAQGVQEAKLAPIW